MEILLLLFCGSVLHFIPTLHAANLDEREQKYFDALKRSEKQILDMVTKFPDGLNDLKKDSTASFDNLAEQVEKRHKDLIEQMTKANEGLKKSFESNYNSLKADTEDNYNAHVANAETNFKTNLSKFKRYCEDVLKKVPKIAADTCTAATAELEKASANAKEKFETFYTELKNETSKKFDIKFGKLTIGAAAKEKKEKHGAGETNATVSATTPAPGKKGESANPSDEPEEFQLSA